MGQPPLGLMAALVTGAISSAAAGAAAGIFTVRNKHESAGEQHQQQVDDEPTPLLRKTTDIQHAMSYAAVAYRNKILRNGKNEPYSKHVVRVATILSEAGINDHIPIMGAFLMGVVPQTYVTLGEVEEEFGPVVGDLMREITEARRQFAVYTGRTRFNNDLSRRAKLVVLARHMDLLRDLAEVRPPGWSDTVVRNHIAGVKEMFAAIRGVSEKLDEEMVEVLQKFDAGRFAG